MKQCDAQYVLGHPLHYRRRFAAGPPVILGYPSLVLPSYLALGLCTNDHSFVGHGNNAPMRHDYLPPTASLKSP